MLSDVAAMLTGSLGMLPSASLGASDATASARPVRARAWLGADIAGTGLANPIAMIGSLAMALRYSFGSAEAADGWRAAISAVLRRGCARRTSVPRVARRRSRRAEMGDAIVAALKEGKG